ncbi:MAG: hypothetical protein JWN92_1276 [Candidatus Acidoferrum typicum]|nr:hypothetical protein [Candidatus Acidoferrum typicum]
MVLIFCLSEQAHRLKSVLLKPERDKTTQTKTWNRESIVEEEVDEDLSRWNRRDG